MSFKYENIQFKGDSGVLGGVLVNLHLGPKSWVKPDKETQELLQHEQGHFDIGHIAVIELLDTLKNKTFLSGTIRADVDTLFLSILNTYHKLGLRYDEETNHGLNKRKQKEWNNFFKNHLEQASK